VVHDRPVEPTRRSPGSRRSAVTAGVGLFLTMATAVPAGAVDEPVHQHAMLVVDDSLTLSMTLAQAFENYPDRPELEARAAQADAWEARGRDWLADRPSLSLRYQTDRWNDNDRLDEYEAGLHLPLWPLNGRRATRDFGEAMRAESAAASLLMRWELAGLLRSVFWDIALAEQDVELAQSSLEIAGRLATAVTRRHELGDVALGDVLLAQSAELEAQTGLIEASANLIDAERAYHMLTGLDRRPPHQSEALSLQEEVQPTHPAFAFADAEIRRAESARELAGRVTSTTPSLLIGPRRERAANAEDFDDSIGMTLTIPFGHSSHRETAVAAAQRELASARAMRNRQLRAQTMLLHEAAHSLDVVRRSIEAASARSTLAEKNRRMAVIAYEKGELELIDFLKLQTNAIAAQRALARLQIEQSRQIAFYNQAVGVLP